MNTMVLGRWVRKTVSVSVIVSGGVSFPEKG